MKFSLAKRLRKEDGASLIEFSLVAFLFLIVMFGVVEMGRMALVYTTMANSARAGTRYAITHGNTRTGGVSYDGPNVPGSTAWIQTVTKNYASAGTVNTNNLTVTVAYPDGNSNTGSRVTVTVSYPYNPLIGYFNTSLGTTLRSVSEGVITF